MHRLRILPKNLEISVPDGANLLEILRDHGLAPDAPCGGQGTCGKCLVIIDGKQVKSCSVSVRSDLTVELPKQNTLQILKAETKAQAYPWDSLAAAFDIGTTTVVCSILDSKSGAVLVSEASANPQSAWGADVVSRIRAALSGDMEAMTDAIRNCMTLLLVTACRKIGANPAGLQRVAVVGNPAMQQLFLGISTKNLAELPFSPALIKSHIQPCGEILPVCPNAELMTVPDISAYVGADTMGCILSSEMYRREEMILMVDIGTNGEMVLGNRHRMIACATAAGPALEGANIRFGMRAAMGAIDHVWLEDGAVRFTTIGGGEPAGICGSGLMDAVAVFLEMGKINSRGRIAPGSETDGERVLHLTNNIYLTQEDIRQVQLAKGAIRAGIELMTREMGISLDNIDQCLLAGAFGSYLSPESACKIGLLPPALLPKIRAVGNAAAEGANHIAANPRLLRLSELLAKNTEYLELASLGEFPRAFAKAMRF